SRHSSAAARPTSGCEPAPRPSVTCAPSWIRRSALDMVRACASVLATTNSTPRRPAVIMLLTALPPPLPTPKTVMRGLSSVMSGFCRLMVIVLVLLPFPAARRRGCRVSPADPLKTLSQPLTDTLQSASGPGGSEPEATPLPVPTFEPHHL